MKYRQKKVQDKDILAIRVALEIDSRWIEGILRDKEGDVLPLPCEVKKGETYIVEVDTDTVLGLYPKAEGDILHMVDYRTYNNEHGTPHYSLDVAEY